MIGSANARLLIVDDEANLRLVLSALLRRAGYEVVAVDSGEAALTLLAERTFDVLLTDLRMPGMSGLDLLHEVIGAWPAMPVIMLTAHGTVDTAVEALKSGAFDFVTKPFDQAELQKTVEEAVSTSRLAQQAPLSVPEVERAPGRYGIIGASPSIEAVFELIARVAATPATVLIEGESGTGKELVARAIYNESRRSEAAFIKLNCAAIPESLIESELFGYEKGAFTGAVTKKPGRFELAHEGTLFLDEIGEIKPEVQVKLLRAIQEGEFEPIGSVQTKKVNVRLIAATNRDLRREVDEGRFREDLYYRLNVVPIRLPPLRERREDIPCIAAHILWRFGLKLDRPGRVLTDDALEWLCAQPWPGNVRQLENVLERTLLLCDSQRLTASDLRGDHVDSTEGNESDESHLSQDTQWALKDVVREATRKVERTMCERALSETEGNVTRAARLLEISRKSLQLKMKEFGLREEPE